MARPKLEIDPTLVLKLAAIHCTMNEIASVVECSVDTLERRFADVIAKGRDQGKMKLRKGLWDLAEDGNLGALIWLSKQHLGMSEKVEQMVDMSLVEKIERLKQLPDEELKQIVMK